MITAVHCDQPSFNNLEFKPGLNIILADRTKESTKKDSRNGLGKTTLIEIIHFCLGAKATKGKGLLVNQLEGWTFTVDLVVNNRKIQVSRKTDQAGIIYIDGDTSDWPIQPELEDEGKSIRLREWNKLLGYLLFGLEIDNDQKYQPTFRSLISYFIRRTRDAFSSPFEHYKRQVTWDKQVHNAFLLGLAWEDASIFQRLKDRTNYLSTLKKAAQSGDIEGFFGTIGELEAQKVRLEDQIKKQQESLSQFRVHPEYQRIEDSANSLTVEVHNLNNQNISDRQLLEYYNSTIHVEEADQKAKDLIVGLYEEAGTVLPDLVQKRLDEVQSFHNHLLQNRREFLSSEIDRLNRQIENRNNEIAEKSDERAALLEILETHGALEEQTLLQNNLLQSIEQLKVLESRLENLKKFEEGASALRIEQETHYQKTLRDFEERREIREQAIALFNENSEALYDAPGILILNVSTTGFFFDIEIERSSSQGIGSMKILCYDLMLAQLWSKRSFSPRMLIHDSTIFDGVDERQIALTLERAAKISEQFGFKYIFALNSDSIPWDDFSEDFDLNQFVRLTLKDDKPENSLLGIRF